MGTLKFTLEVGALLRRHVVNEIKNVAFMRNLKLDIDEDKSFLESNFRFKLEGPDEKILSAKSSIETLLARLGAPISF